MRIHRRSQLCCFSRECRQVLYSLTDRPEQELQEFGTTLLQHLLESFGCFGGELSDSEKTSTLQFGQSVRETQRECAAVVSYCDQKAAERHKTCCFQCKAARAPW